MSTLVIINYGFTYITIDENINTRLDLISCVFLTNNGIVTNGAKPQVYDNHSIVIVQQSANSG